MKRTVVEDATLIAISGAEERDLNSPIRGRINRYLADRTARSTTTINAHLKKLEERAQIEVVWNPQGRPSNATEKFKGFPEHVALTEVGRDRLRWLLRPEEEIVPSGEITAPEIDERLPGVFVRIEQKLDRLLAELGVSDD